MTAQKPCSLRWENRPVDVKVGTWRQPRLLQCAGCGLTSANSLPTPARNVTGTLLGVLSWRGDCSRSGKLFADVR